MRVVREWVHRLWSTLVRGKGDEDLEDELRLHLELVAEDARRRGHDPEEALRQARLEAGGRAQAMEALRDQRGLPWVEDLARDVRFGLRTLRRRPGLTAAAVLSLALGVGANAGIFSLFDRALLRALPVTDPGRLVQLAWNGNALVTTWGSGDLLPYPVCQELDEQDRFFEGVFCRHPEEVLASTGRQHDRIRAEIVSGSYFRLLGVQPELGRLIDESDNQQPDAHPVVVVSYGYWKSVLGGASDVVGSRLLVNNHPMTVIGIAPATFIGVDPLAAPAIWIPAMMLRQAYPELGPRLFDRRTAWVHAFGRLRAGVTADDAKAGLQPWFASRLEADTRVAGFPPVTADQRREFLASSLDLWSGARGLSDLRVVLERPLLVLTWCALLLLLLAALNVSGLLLARGAERSQELTTRMALGASRGRVTRQLMVEGLLLACAGGAVGLVAAPTISRAILWFLPEGVTLVPGLDRRVFLAALAASGAAGLVCGLAPALHAARRPLASSINGRATPARAGVRARKVLVGAQIAFTVVLLTGAALFVQTFDRLSTRDLGFSSGNLLMFSLNPPAIGYSEADAARLMRDVLRALERLPDVERAALANTGLLTGGSFSRVLTIDASERIVTDTTPGMRVTPGFFETVGVPVVAGRDFAEPDTRDIETAGYRTVIVNESFARRYFGTRSPVGARLGQGNRPDTVTNIEIVGVVADFAYRFVHEEGSAYIFFPFAQTGPLAGDGRFFVKASTHPDAALAPVRAAVTALDPSLPLLSLTTLDDQIGRSLQFERMLATLSSAFGAIALVLSAVGLFGVMSFVVTLRTQEIGMRLALGDSPGSVVWLVARESLVIIGAGLAVGTAIVVTVGMAAPSWLTGVLYGVSSLDPRTVAAVIGALMAVALTACIAPAGRAAALSPMMAIRDQSESAWAIAKQGVLRAAREQADGDGVAAPSALAYEVAGAVRRASSFPHAVDVALATLRDRVGARGIRLLEKRAAGDGYQCAAYAIPSDGVLINRLKHYSRPLPITPGDLRAWRTWAQQHRPEHVTEIDTLDGDDVRMAVALRTPQEIVGVLLLGSPETRDGFTRAEKQLLIGAADTFSLLIENARLSGRALEQEKLRRDLSLAAEVQRRLLPSELPAADVAEFSAVSLPARSIGGDYYDFIQAGERRIGIALADVSGKGIAAALIMSVVQASLRVIASDGDISLPQLAARMNEFLYRTTPGNKYATFFYAQVDGDRRQLRYVNAGHNPPLLVRAGGSPGGPVCDPEIQELTVGGAVVGMLPVSAYEEAVVDLRPGDVLLAFTDGVTEARSPDEEEFGEERLKRLVSAHLHVPAAEIAARLSSALKDWIRDADQFDDLTFVVMKVY